ncbi:MAG: hypothetical protein ACXWCP_21500, partial [Burkholderiales bacterium]
FAIAVVLWRGDCLTEAYTIKKRHNASGKQRRLDDKRSGHCNSSLALLCAGCAAPQAEGGPACELTCGDGSKRLGEYLGTVPVPRRPTNVAFSGPD